MGGAAGRAGAAAACAGGGVDAAAPLDAAPLGADGDSESSTQVILRPSTSQSRTHGEV